MGVGWVLTVARPEGSYQKLIDEEEAYRLLVEDGKTLRWMVGFYREKYGVSTTPAMWSRLRIQWSGKRASGREPGAPDGLLVPKGVTAVPWKSPQTVERPGLRDGLRALSRSYWGEFDMLEREPVSTLKLARSLVERCLLGDLVVDYSTDPYPSFSLVERRSVDTGWIRNPFVDDDGSPAGSPLALAQVLKPDAVLAYLSDYPSDLPLRPVLPRRGSVDDEVRAAVDRVMRERREGWKNYVDVKSSF